MWITDYPRSAPRQGRAGLHGAGARPACGPASSPSTRSASTSAAGCPSARPRSGSSARATARSTTRSARRRAARPRGLDRFAMTVDGRRADTVDTGTIIQGPPIGTNTTGQEAEGPHCTQRRRTSPPARPHPPPCPSPPPRRSPPSTDDRPHSSPSSSWRRSSTSSSTSCSRARPSSARDRAGRQPQAVLRRRGPRGSEAHRRSTLALVVLFVLAVGIPLYWIMEPGRQENAAEGFDEKLRQPGRGAVRRHR